MKNAFGRQKSTGAPPPPGTSSGRLGTATRAAQQQNNAIGAPPGSASRRLQTGAGTAQKRPTTAVQGAGFMSGSLGSNNSSSLAPTQFEKKEETYVPIDVEREDDLLLTILVLKIKRKKWRRRSLI